MKKLLLWIAQYRLNQSFRRLDALHYKCMSATNIFEFDRLSSKWSAERERWYSLLDNYNNLKTK